MKALLDRNRDLDGDFCKDGRTRRSEDSDVMRGLHRICIKPVEVLCGLAQSQ